MQTRSPYSLLLPRILITLLLFMQYAVAAHTAEHHLFDDPLTAANSQCDDVHLQQPFGQLPDIAFDQAPAPATGPFANPVTLIAADTAVAGFRSRAPPLPLQLQA